jgi:hypothetical protein
MYWQLGFLKIANTHDDVFAKGMRSRDLGGCKVFTGSS